MLVRWRKLDSCAMDVKSRVYAKNERGVIVSGSDLQRGE